MLKITNSESRWSDKKVNAIPLRITVRHLAILLRYAVQQINTDKKKNIAVKSVLEYEQVIKFYLKKKILDAINTGHSSDLGVAGHLQVLEKLSRKDWKWDKKYHGRDFDFLFITPVNAAKVKLAPVHQGRMLALAAGGKRYSETVNNPVKRIDEILALLDG